MNELLLRVELSAFQDRYMSILDNDRLEEWPTLFTESCLYEIIPKENEDLGLPAPVIRCGNTKMLRDRVISLRNANIYEKPTYRHFTSGMEYQRDGQDAFEMQSSYLVINTSLAGESYIYQAGRYLDRIVRTGDGLRFERKRCVYDTLRVRTLLAVPI